MLPQQMLFLCHGISTGYVGIIETFYLIRQLLKLQFFAGFCQRFAVGQADDRRSR